METEVGTLRLYEMDLDTQEMKKLWSEIVKQAKEDLVECPKSIHAECLRTNAVEFLKSPIAEEAFDFIYPENGLKELQQLLSTLEPCKHATQSNALRDLIK